MRKQITALIMGTILFVSTPTALVKAEEWKEIAAEETVLAAGNDVSSGEDGFVIVDGVLDKYSGDAAEVVIPEGVTAIGSFAFDECSGLTAVTIPESVTAIGNYAFYNCSSLKAVTIPQSVTSIGNDVFDGCSGLTSVTIPGSVKSIGESVFQDCSSLTSVEISEGVTDIADGMFGNCSSLTSVTIPGSVKRIGIRAFYGCSGLTGVTIPEGVTSIKESAFYSCSSLTNVIIPESVTSIGDQAFLDCSSLTSVTIPESVASIGGSAFGGTKWLENERTKNPLVIVNHILIDASTSSGAVVIPQGVTSIGDWAFVGSDLVSVTIPESVTSIGNFAFMGCRLTSVVIPESVTNIGNYAFWTCYELTDIKIPESVTSIGWGTFYVTKWLENKRAKDPLVIVNHILIDAYTSSGDVTIPEGVTNIGGLAFSECGSLTSVTIPTGVTSIGTGAFLNCSSLTRVAIPESVTEIGISAFDECEKLTIYGKEGSYAQTYAVEYGIPFSADKIIESKKTELSTCTIIITPSSYIYDGTAKAPTATVRDGDRTLTAGTDYTVQYNNNINAGTAQIIFTGKDNYTGTVQRNFTITAADINQASISVSATGYSYDGTAKEPAVTVKLGQTTLLKDKDYSVSYQNNKNIGTASLTVTGLGNYKGTVEKTFEITAKKGTVVTSGAYKYKFTSASEVSFAGLKSAKTTKVTIPAAVNIGGKSFKVTSVEAKALQKNAKVTSVTIGTNVKSIGSSAFDGCKKLKSVTVKSAKLKKVGKNAFKGIKSTAKIKVPKAKLKAYKKLLKGKGQGSKVKITR